MQVAINETAFHLQTCLIDLSGVEPHLPALRRHAEAMSGSQASADAYTGALLEILATDSSILPAGSSSKVGLFKLYNRLYANLFNQDRREEDGYRQLSWQARQVLFLVLSEDFTIDETADIMDMTASEVEAIVRTGGGATPLYN
ncbi:hypothetical protein [Niveispirillum sp. KHB5.9]|uniref:hypothetical protein n=1 Tax=Niveispirillum sp. KHB5.9 TaxID=3400269 RepID=UPI003A87E047